MRPKRPLTLRDKDAALLKQVKRFSRQELVECASTLLGSSLAQLRAIREDRQAPVIKVMLASICARIIARGDMHALDTLMNRLIGKVRDDVKVSGSIDAPPAQVVIMLPPNGRDLKNVTPTLLPTIDAPDENAYEDIDDIDLGF